MKKSILIIITLICSMSLLTTACGGNATGSTTTAAATQAAATTVAATDANATTAAEQKTESAESLDEIVISFGCTPGSFEDGIPEGYSVLDEITKQTGVKIDIVNIDRDKFRVLAAGQNLPDTFMIYDASMISSLINSGAMYGLNDIIAANAPNVAELYKMSMDYQTLIFGDTYCFPYNIYDEPSDKHIPLRNGVVSFYTRYDLYKEIGSPEIKDSWSGYLDVLEELQAYAREKYQDENIYCFSAWTDWGIYPYICVYPFTQGYGDIYDVNQLVDATTGELEDVFLCEDGVFWEGIKFFNDAHRRGLFDPEGLTQKYSQYEDKLKTGKTLVNLVAWIDPNDDLKEQGAAYVILPNSVGKQMMLTPDILPMGNRFSDAVAINSTFKYPERYIQFMNWANSTDGKRTLANGVKGETWDYIDGVPQFIGIFKDEYLYTPDWEEYHNKYPSGIYGDKSLGMRAFASDINNGFADDGYPYRLMNLPEFIALTATEPERAFAKDFGCTYPGEVYMKWVKEGKMEFSEIYLTMPAQLFGTVTEEISVTVSRAMQHFEANLGKVILASTPEEYEKEKAIIISDLKDLGLDEASAAIAKQFEDAKQLVDQFVK